MNLEIVMRTVKLPDFSTSGSCYAVLLILILLNFRRFMEISMNSDQGRSKDIRARSSTCEEGG